MQQIMYYSSSSSSSGEGGDNNNNNNDRGHSTDEMDHYISANHPWSKAPYHQWQQDHHRQQQQQQMYSEASLDYVSSSQDDGESDVFGYKDKELLQRLSSPPTIPRTPHLVFDSGEESSSSSSTAAVAVKATVSPGKKKMAEDEVCNHCNRSTPSTGADNVDDNEKNNNVGTNEDEREVISTLKLEEKIVALMNSIWLLETENNLLRSEVWNPAPNASTGASASANATTPTTTANVSTAASAASTTDGPRTKTIIEDMYSDPYYAPLDSSHSKTNDDTVPDSNQNDGSDKKTALEVPDAIADTLTAMMDPTPSVLKKTTLEQLDRRSLVVEVDHQQKQALLHERKALRKELKVSEGVRERMRVAMVSLETQTKLQSELVQELTDELEQAREDLSTAAAAASQKALHEDQRESASNSRQQYYHSEVPNQLSSPEPSSSVQAAEMISDLSSELRLTLERESELKQILAETRTHLAEERKRHRSDEDRSAAEARSAAQELVGLSRQIRDLTHQQYQERFEKEAIQEHATELETLNATLVQKFGSLEARFLAFVDETTNANTSTNAGGAPQQRAQPTPQQPHRHHRHRHHHLPDAGAENDEYVSSLKIRNRKQRKEIAGLKDRLLRTETSLTHFLTRFSNPNVVDKRRPLHARPPPDTTEGLRQRRQQDYMDESQTTTEYTDESQTTTTGYNDDSYESQSPDESLDWNDVVNDIQNGHHHNRRLRRRSSVSWKEEIESESGGDAAEPPYFFHNDEQREDENSDVGTMFHDRVEI